MSALVEMLTGLAKNFPVTMTGITLIGGLAVGNLAWMFMGLASLTVIIVCLVIQLPLGTTFPTFPRSSEAALLQACALIPTASASAGSGTTYFPIPSMWVALTTFFLTYILFNAATVYTTQPTKLPKEALPVQYRKSIGIVSIITTLMMFLALIIFRLQTGCEHMTSIMGIPVPVGLLAGIVIGGLVGGGLYTIFHASGTPLNTDVHGVMSGLQPGSLRDHPLACKATATASA